MLLKQVLPYLANSALRHADHTLTVDMAKELEAVFGKKLPAYLKDNKPLENERERQYKTAIYRNLHKGFPGRLIDKLDAIRKSDDFSVIFPAWEGKPEESLQAYLETGFGLSKSLTNWTFSTLTRAYVWDPNAVAVVLQKEQPATDRDLPQPLAYVIPSVRVIDYVAGKWAVLESEEKSILNAKSVRPRREGRILYFFDDVHYCVARQLTSGQGGTWEILGVSVAVTPTPAPSLTDTALLATGQGPEMDVPGAVFSPPQHYCGTVPAVRIGKASQCIKGQESGRPIYESILAAALPSIQVAQEIYLSAMLEFYQHLYSQKWEWGAVDCPLIEQHVCSKGVLTQPYMSHKLGERCPICEGTGSVGHSSVLRTLRVTPPKSDFNSDQKPLITPPFAGYVEKQVEPLKVMLEEVERLERKGWSELEMAWMNDVPLSQSGDAKEMDQKPANDWHASQSGHLLGDIQAPFGGWVARQRYAIFLASLEKVDATLPVIKEPVDFGLYNADALLNQIGKARENGLTGSTLAAMEYDFVRKRTGKDSAVARVLRLSSLIQPLFGVDILDRAALIGGQLGQAMTDVEQVMALRFEDLVQRALREEGDTWWELQPQKQLDLLEKYAGEILKKLPKVQPLYNAFGKPPLDGGPSHGNPGTPGAAGAA